MHLPPGPRQSLERIHVDQARVRRTEAARIEVDGPKVGLEVDVEPLASCCLRALGDAADQFGANTATLPPATDSQSG